MKIAVLSDVHGNLPALEAVLEDIDQWGAERVVANGDLVNRGPDSPGVLNRLRERQPAAVTLRGNHETFVLACLRDDFPTAGIRGRVKRFARWTFEQLGPSTIEAIQGWADHLDLDHLEGGAVHFTHGSRLGNRDGVHPRTPETDLGPKLGDPRDLFVASHTHWPMVREYQGNLVVNTGSVGSPFDRDPRACYARLSFSGGRWRAAIRRIAYDRDAAERSFEDSGFLPGAGPLGRLMLYEFRLSRGLMGPWMRAYHQAVLDGDLDLEESVDRLLREWI